MRKNHLSSSSVDPVKLLSGTELFCDLDSSILKDLSSELNLVRVRGGETLMQEGDPGDCMYTVISGRLHAFIRSQDGTEQFIGEIGSGESVGEMALITGEDRSATVRVARDTELVKISKTGFERIVQKYPEALMEIARVIVTRMRRMMHSFSPISPLKTIAILPAGMDAPLSEFVQKLCKSLETTGRVLHLNRQRFESIHGEGASLLNGDEWSEKKSSITAWLSTQESEYQLILYESDVNISAWTMRCIRQADRILLVGRADSNPNLNEIESEVFRNVQNMVPAQKELVLLHEDKERIPVGTESWLKRRSVMRHHHVCLHRQEDFERLARILSGRAIGLVLGGGGARGFAHIGVIRAIEEAGVPVDMICGVSMGSILAAQYAMGCNYQTMLQMNKKGLVENKLERNITLPLISISSGRKFKRVLEMFYGDTQIEDLWLNFFCLSCNLSTAEAVVHRKGLLWKAVAASNAAPTILPPSIEEGNLLVDGGVVNNQPGDIMKEYCGGLVIVTNVSPEKDMTVDASFSEMPSPWKILRNRLNPFKKSINVPNIFAMMMRTIMVSSQKKSHEVEMKADYYLRPPLNQFKINDYAKIDEIADVGYRYAKEQIKEWSKIIRTAKPSSD